MPNLANVSKSPRQVMLDSLKFRLEEFKTVQESENDGDRDEVLDSILEITPTITYKILLSWGGPADGFYFDFFENEHKENAIGELKGIRYFRSNWGEYEEEELQAEEKEIVFNMFRDVIPE